MSSSQDQNEAKSKKKRSILGMLFNPRLEFEIEPIKHAARMFVRMIALVFASYDLFPREHPAYRDFSVPLTLRDVIATAFGQLSFTKQGLPKVLVFVAVIGCLVFGALFVITLLLSMVVTPAHAEEIFQTTIDDWGIQWINYLFFGEKMTTTLGYVDPPEGSAMQSAMGTALAFYSTAVLVLAGFLLLYHLVFMVAETAHTGKPFGKANQIWAPIRLVFAIGLLVPVGSGGSSVSGYNTAQYITMEVGRWGSALGTNVWAKFNDALAGAESATTYGACVKTGTPSCAKLANVAQNMIGGLMQMAACSKFLNFQIKAIGGNNDLQTYGSAATSLVPPTDYVPSLSSLKSSATEKGKYQIGIAGKAKDYGDVSGLEGICGGFEVLPIPGVDTASGETNYYQKVYEVQREVFAKYLSKVDGLVEDYYEYFVPQLEVFLPDEYKKADFQDDLQELVNSFQEDLEEEVMAALESSKDEAYKKVVGADSGGVEDGGWLLAGAWFNRIAMMMAQREASMTGGLPRLIAPGILSGGYTSNNQVTKGVIQATKDNLAQFIRDTNDAVTYTVAEKATIPNALKGFDHNPFIDAAFAEQNMKDSSVLQSLSILGKSLGQEIGIWGEGGLLVRFGSTLDPMAELAAFGQKFTDFGGRLFAYAFALDAGKTAVEAIFKKDAMISSLKPFGNAIVGLMCSVAGFLFLIGFTLAFVIPLYPFYRFFFGAFTWIMMVFEGVVLAPLFALAHVNPYGEGLAGQYGKYGYSVMVQILLRPVMMVFGLIAGFLLFTVAVHLLNEAFTIATAGIGANSDTNAILAFITYSILYCVVCVVLANQAFSTIGLFPQVILSYLGLGKVQEENTGNPQMLAGAATYLSKDMLSGGRLKGIATIPSQMRKEAVDNAANFSNTHGTNATKTDDAAILQKKANNAIINQNNSGNSRNKNPGEIKIE